MGIVRFLLKRWFLLNSIWNFEYIIFRFFGEKKEFKKFFELNTKKSDKTISVITPTYKIKAALLVDFFESLDRQTNSNFEFCLCNDGDKDTAAIAAIQKFQKKWGERFKYIEHPTNKGISEATNSAISLATGDFLLFIDADDELHPQTVEALNHYIGTNPEVDFIYTDHDLMTDWGLRYRAIRKPFLSPELFLTVNYMNHLTVIKASFFKTLDRPFRKEYDGGQDFSLCLKAIQKRAYFGYIPLILYFWRMHPGSVAMNPLSKPWAYKGFRKVQQDIIGEMTHGKISVDENHGKFLLNTVEQKKYSLLVVVFGKMENNLDFFKSKVNSQLKSTEEVLEINFAKLDHPSECENYLSKLDDSAFILFLNDRLLEETEISFIQDTIAYAMIEKVSCVFPYLKKGKKACYDFQGSYFFKMNRELEYSTFAGNVVTGPTHGLVVQKSKLVLAFAEIKKENLSDWNQLGPLLGIHSLNLNYRNVSSSGIQCEQSLEPFSSNALKLKFNPYH